MVKDFPFLIYTDLLKQFHVSNKNLWDLIQDYKEWAPSMRNSPTLQTLLSIRLNKNTLGMGWGN